LVVGEVFEDLPTLLNPPGYQARLLFPADDAQPLQAYAPGDQPLLLVVPDGTGARRANCCISIRCWRRCHG
jgi:DTW domain-containing protein YfiP